MPKANFTGQWKQPIRVVDMNATGVCRYLIGRRGVQVTPERFNVPPREQVPRGHIKARNHLMERTPLRALTRADGCRLIEMVKQIGRFGERVVEYQFGDVEHQKVYAVLRPGGRPVREYLTPAKSTIAIFEAHENAGPVPHGAERRSNRTVNRITAGPGINAVNPHRTIGLIFG